VTLPEYIAWLERAIDRMELGAPAMANAMARYLAERTADDTLRQNTHAPGAYYRARAGAPPAYVSGSLAKGMFVTEAPASAGVRATAIVGNEARHARLLEFGGCVLQPTHGEVMSWSDTGGAWRHRALPAPAHPFLRPTAEDAAGDGSLTQVAIDAFRPYDP
jgi:hypothetical protein